MKLNILLTTARKKAGFTLRQLEEVTGISNSLLSQIETGAVKNPSFQTIVKICNALSIPLKQIEKLD